jgi:hypothetical protein
MTIARSVAKVLGEHVTLDLECIDRMYLNLYVPILQTPEGTAWFWRRHPWLPVCFLRTHGSDVSGFCEADRGIRRAGGHRCCHVSQG